MWDSYTICLCSCWIVHCVLSLISVLGFDTYVFTWQNVFVTLNYSASLPKLHGPFIWFMASVFTGCVKGLHIVLFCIVSIFLHLVILLNPKFWAEFTAGCKCKSNWEYQLFAEAINGLLQCLILILVKYCACRCQQAAFYRPYWNRHYLMNFLMIAGNSTIVKSSIVILLLLMWLELACMKVCLDIAFLN